MKQLRFCSLIIVLIILIACFSGCIQIKLTPGQSTSPSHEPTQTQSQQSSMPTESEIVQPTDEPAQTHDISDAIIEDTFSVDTDNDGTDETVYTATGETDGDTSYFEYISVYVQDGSEIKETHLDDVVISYESAYIMRTDNGSSCLLVTLGYEDAFYTTFAISFKESSAVLENSIWGYITNITGTEITIADDVDALRSWIYHQTFKLGDDFSLTPVTEMMIELSDGIAPLHTIKKLPVQMLVNGVFTKDYVEAGEDIYPVSTDGESYLDFTLKDGSKGRIYYTYDDVLLDYVIDGISEYEYFDNIDYWG